MHFEVQPMIKQPESGVGSQSKGLLSGTPDESTNTGFGDRRQSLHILLLFTQTNLIIIPQIIPFQLAS